MDNERKEVNLADYLGEHQVLLTSLAVFATLAALMPSFQIKWLGSIISFFCLAAMVLIWLELHLLPTENPHPRLKLFRLIMQWGFYSLVAYWLIEFRVFWRMVLFIPLTIAIVYGIAKWIRGKKRRFPRVAAALGFGPTQTPLQRMLFNIIVTVISFVSFVIAVWLSIPAVVLMEALGRIQG